MTPTEAMHQFQEPSNALDTVNKHCQRLREKGLLITEWDAEALGLEPDRCGRLGSPTWVKKIERVVLTGGEHKAFSPTDEGVSQLMKELMDDHTFG
jgi:hypothetical protein